MAEKNLSEMRAPRREHDTAGPQATGKQDPVYQITSGKQPRKPTVTAVEHPDIKLQSANLKTSRVDFVARRAT